MWRFTLREKCPNTEIFLVRGFLYSDRIQENMEQKRLCILILLTRMPKVKKYETLVKYLSFCTHHRVITITYFKIHQRKLTQYFFSQMRLMH